ncbi:MAG: hypothetical protein WCR42_00370 [bacterium]
MKIDYRFRGNDIRLLLIFNFQFSINGDRFFTLYNISNQLIIREIPAFAGMTA